MAVRTLVLVTALTAVSFAEEVDPRWRHRTLVSSATGAPFATATVTAESFGMPDAFPWRVTTRTLHGGLQEGVQVVAIDNGSMVIELVPTRGMSILSVRKGDLRLGWESPVKEVVHPRWINLDARGGLGWLEGFNEFLVRCGLEYAGAPGHDDAVGANLTLHGRIGNLAASEVVLFVEEAPPHRLRLRGVVRERMFHGAKLDLATELTTTPGSDEFQIVDTVTNRGGVEQEFQLIYHSNYGAPLLEAGATFHAPARSVTPRETHAAESLDSYAVYDAPTSGFAEQVYLIEPLADAEGRSVALLANSAGDAGASIRWSTEELPYLTLWKDTGAAEDGYVTGIEPGTGYPFNRSVERGFGRVPKLAPRESRRFTLRYALHETAEEVTAVRDEVQRLQGAEPTRLVRDPPTIP